MKTCIDQNGCVSDHLGSDCLDVKVPMFVGGKDIAKELASLVQSVSALEAQVAQLTAKLAAVAGTKTGTTTKPAAPTTEPAVTGSISQ